MQSEREKHRLYAQEEPVRTLTFVLVRCDLIPGRL